MRSSRFTAFSFAALQCLVGCAALVTGPGTDEAELLHPGSTEVQLTQRLGVPIRKEALATPLKAFQIREKDSAVSNLAPRETAVSVSVFSFTGRLGSQKARAGQAGFDSFMTLGLAELYLIPKALWERLADEELELTVWFDSAGNALAYKWSPKSKPIAPGSR